MYNKAKRWILPAIVLASFFTILGGECVFAIDWNSINAKAALEGAYDCATGGSTGRGSGRGQNAYKAKWDVANDGARSGFIAPAAKELINLVVMPYQKNGVILAHPTNLNCSEVMIGASRGDQKFDGLIPHFSTGGSQGNYRDCESSNYNDCLGKTNGAVSAEVSQAISFFAGPSGDGNGGIGYISDAGQETIQQIDLSIIGTSGCGNNNSVAVSFLQNGTTNGDFEFGKEYDFCDTKVTIEKEGDDFNIYKFIYTGVNDSTGEKTYSKKIGQGPDCKIKADATVECYLNDLKKEDIIVTPSTKEVMTGTRLTMIDGDFATQMLLGLNRRNNMRYNVSGLAGWDDLALSRQEVYDLYAYYLRDVFDVSVFCEGDSAYSENYGEAINFMKDKKCRADIGGAKNISNVYGVDNNRHFSNKPLSVSDIVKTLEGLGDLSDLDTRGTTSVGDQDPSSDNKETCMSSGVAGSMSWILCPIMEMATENATKIYQEMVEPFLQVKPEVLSENATRNVWTVMVGIANTAVVIFLLVIIFSQLTGVGIDNYNIKKSLPKIIVVAVLVNMSYLVCQLAVDVSNVVGNGLNSMLSSVDPLEGKKDLTIKKMNYKTRDEEDEVLAALEEGKNGNNAAWFKTVLDVAVAAAGVGGIATLISGISNSGWFAGLVLPVILLLITVLFAVIFFFILMGVRQAGVVMLVILSPLAMVCYMLPNTKKYFDKWKKAFGGLLLLYPICGVLIGGGQLTSKILVSVSPDYLMYFVGCIIMVVPFFMIPSMLKGSLAAMGNIGAKVSGLGKTLGSRSRGMADKGIKNSKAYQERVKYNQEQSALRRANRIKDRLGKTPDEQLTKRQRMKLMAANDTILADRDKDKRAESSAKDINFMAREIAQDKKFEGEELANYMTYINDKTRNGEDEDALFALYDKFMREDNKSGAVAVARIAGRRKDTAQKFMNEKFNDLSGYTPKLAQSIAKEISTGENNRMYMESAPLQFEYAAQLNRARDLQYNTDTGQFEYTVKDKDGNDQTASMAAQFKTTREVVDPNGVKRTEIVGGWANNQQNIHSAVDKYITDRSQLAGMKGSSLEELYQLMEAKDASGKPVMNDQDKAHLQKLAAEHIENGLKGLEKIDYTKAQQYADLSGGAYTYNPNTREFTKNTTPTPTPAPAPTPTPTPAPSPANVDYNAIYERNTESSPARRESSAKPTADSQDQTRIDLDHSRDRIYNNENQSGGDISEL